MQAASRSPRRLNQLLAKTTRAAQAAATVEGPDTFAQLTQQLAAILGVDATMIATMVPGAPGRASARATWLDGRHLRTFDYDLARTPCSGVVGKQSRFVARGVREEFAPGTVFYALGFDSYAAQSLVDGSGRQLGLIVAIDRKPLRDAIVTEAVVQIFAVRASAELERERSEAALRASEASYRAIFEANEDAIFVHDWDTGAILDVSPKASELYGYPREALQRMRVGEISANVPTYTEADAVRHIERAKASAQPLRFEWQAKHRDGRLMWHEVTLKRTEIAGQRRVLAFVRDITEHKRAAEALHTSEEQYRAIFNASADALVLWDSELRRVDVNPAYERLFGTTREEVLTDADRVGLPQDYVERRRDLVRRTLAGESCQVELESRRKDGGRLDIEVRTIPIRHRGEPHVLAIARDVTQRKLAEAALRASEEQYRGIFDASVDGLLLWDGDHRIVDVNDAFLSMHGYRRGELVGRTGAVFIPPDLKGQCAGLLPGILAGTACHLEARSRRKDGTDFDVEIHGVPMQYQGRPHVLIILRDITERQRAAERSRASEEQYRVIFDGSADALALWDHTIRMVDVNAAMTAMYGYARDEVVGKSYRDRMPRAAIEKRIELIRRALAGQQGQLETVGVRKDGEHFDVELRFLPIDFRAEPHVLVIARDITERKRAEQALRDSEEQYRSIFNASADALVLRDADFRIVDVNATYEAMSGYTRDEVIGIDRVLANPAEVSAAIRALHGRALAGEPIVFETQLIRRDGARYELELRGVPILHRGAPHVLYMGRDITARRRAESQRRELEVQLSQAQKMEAIGQLTGGIAHDFNNILASIMGYVGMALERPGALDDRKLADYLEQASNSCRRARDLIQQMLIFSRGQHGRRQPVRLAALLDESVRLMRAMLLASNELKLETVDDTAVVEVDPVQMQQVLLNLGINARDATGGGGTIRIGARQRHLAASVCASCAETFSGHFHELWVEDDGPGLPAELKRRIFEPFFSTKAPGQGTGMGLATVHRIVHDHAGHMDVESNGRTRFAVFIPAAAGPPQSLGEEKTLDRAGAAPAKLRGRVLLVDDEESVLRVMQELLRNWGLNVAAMREPQGAHAMLSRDPSAFDVVLTDLTMPRMSGLELAQAIRLLPSVVPVLLYSGNPEGLDAETLSEAGVVRVLHKPVEPAELRAALQSCLEDSA